MKIHLSPWITLCLAVLILVVAYTLLDNHRVVVVNQQVEIEDLPEELEGFTILQISDLHGRRFGKDQRNLLARINQTHYDMLAITGDMNDGYHPDNQPFFDLLDGIENKENMFYTSGNTGPWAFDEFNGELTEDGKKLQEKGVKNLNHLYSIRRGESSVWVGEFWLVDTIKLCNIGFSQQRLEEPDLPEEEQFYFQTAQQYALDLISNLKKINPEDTLIGLTHVPFSIDSASAMPRIDPSYDLVLAGHYHGGQIRLPLAGALYIPDGASETGGFFPRQDEVSGLKDWGNFQQYISRGLGSSGIVPWLNFRLFNTPEINLITLHARQ